MSKRYSCYHNFLEKNGRFCHLEHYLHFRAVNGSSGGDGGGGQTKKIYKRSTTAEIINIFYNWQTYVNLLKNCYYKTYKNIVTVVRIHIPSCFHFYFSYTLIKLKKYNVSHFYFKKILWFHWIWIIFMVTYSQMM